MVIVSPVRSTYGGYYGLVVSYAAASCVRRVRIYHAIIKKYTSIK